MVGLALLLGGAELLVRGAVRLAAAAGISSLVIGLTVVAFGTSAPEMAVSVRSALASQEGADIAIGNVVGSNIFNILVILGLSAAVVPLKVSPQLIRVDVPIMIGASLLVAVLAVDGQISPLEGLLLFMGVIAYIFFAIRLGRRLGKSARIADTPSRLSGRRAMGGNVALIVVGLVCLTIGSQWLVDGATTIARSLGVSELIIALTLVAAGTSLPEVATSLVAALKGERDIAVGNAVGSNIFNILSVLGLSALVGTAGVHVPPDALRFGIPVMIAVAVACVPIFFTGSRISRGEGLLFLGYYGLYGVYLISAATGRQSLDSWSRWILLLVAPLTIVVLSATVIQQIRKDRRAKS